MKFLSGPIPLPPPPPPSPSPFHRGVPRLGGLRPECHLRGERRLPRADRQHGHQEAAGRRSRKEVNAALPITCRANLDLVGLFSYQNPDQAKNEPGRYWSEWAQSTCNRVKKKSDLSVRPSYDITAQSSAERTVVWDDGAYNVTLTAALRSADSNYGAIGG